MNIGGSISGAVFSDDRRMYRYALWRIWDFALESLLFIGLNPSTAEHVKDDPTIRHLIGLAKRLGFGGLYVGNLYSLVTPEPALLWFEDSRSLLRGPNDTVLKCMRELSSTALVGWGDCGTRAGTRPAEVLAIIGAPVYCLKVNKTREPCHPLYMPLSSQLIPYIRKER